MPSTDTLYSKADTALGLLASGCGGDGGGSDSPGDYSSYSTPTRPVLY